MENISSEAALWVNHGFCTWPLGPIKRVEVYGVPSASGAACRGDVDVFDMCPAPPPWDYTVLAPRAASTGSFLVSDECVLADHSVHRIPEHGYEIVVEYQDRVYMFEQPSGVLWYSGVVRSDPFEVKPPSAAPTSPAPESL